MLRPSTAWKHTDQPANNRVFQARYSNAIDPLFNAVAEAQKKLKP